MASAILGIIGSVLLMIIGVWKYAGRRAAYKRQLVEQAQKDLDEAEKNKDTSGITAAIDDINRL
jgi:hypothetical protein